MSTQDDYTRAQRQRWALGHVRSTCAALKRIQAARSVSMQAAAEEGCTHDQIAHAAGVTRQAVQQQLKKGTPT